MSPSLRFAIPLFALAAGCSKMSPEECTKLRDNAFELINTANMCSSDADCDGTAGVCVIEQPFQLDGIVSCPP